jgi:hypothetical protein
MSNLKLAAVGCLIAFVLAACARRAETPAPGGTAASVRHGVIPLADRPPAALTEIGDSAVWLFDAADAADWPAAADRLASMSESAAALPDHLEPSDVTAKLEPLLEDVNERVTAHDRVATLEDANAMTRLVAELSGQFQTSVPFEAVLLGYYGRQLVVGVVAGRPSVLARATIDLRSTWDTLRGRIEENGWIDEARRFTDIVVQIEAAVRPADFVAATRSERTEADRIQLLFRSAN